MIDFIKFKITDEVLINEIWRNPILVYDGKADKIIDNKLKKRITRRYENLYFTKFFNRLEISGSIHKFYNNDVHNADDFTIKKVIQVIDHLKELFELDLEKCFIINLEYGINIISPIAINKLIANLIYHEKRQFYRTTKHLYYEIAGVDAYKNIKVYNKHIQHPKFCKENTFRFEVKSKQAKFINKLEIHTLSDLLSNKTHQALGCSLLQEWNNILLFDKKANVDEKYFNTNFWENTITVKSRNLFNYHKKKYFKQLGKSNLHSKIHGLIHQKILQLM